MRPWLVQANCTGKAHVLRISIDDNELRTVATWAFNNASTIQHGLLRCSAKPASPASSTSTRDRAFQRHRTVAGRLQKRGGLVAGNACRVADETCRMLHPKQPPSSNYVVCDPNIIDIMKKYGIAGAAPLAAGFGFPPVGNEQRM